GEEPERFAPAQWTFALQGGVWLPTGSVAKEFFGACCSPTGMMEGGYLIKERFGFELGVGGFYDSGVARGVDSGELSQDSFALLLIPLTTNVTVRGRFWPRQSVIPFLRGGADAIFFRENDAGTVIKGIKWGLHGGLGMQVSLRHLTKIEPEFEFGVKDASLLVEGRYRWVDNFGKGGLDLSGLLGTVGILMEF
ncbi:MAG: hypothetical protein HYV03_00935, partial [Deltaproteobacteria bacterium]|nr:hypothetical protein [Deltaproteobacteria bacterium]